MGEGAEILRMGRRVKSGKGRRFGEEKTELGMVM